LELHAELDQVLGVGVDPGVFLQQVGEADDRVDDRLAGDPALAQQPPTGRADAAEVPARVVAVGAAAGAREEEFVEAFQAK